MKRRFFFYGTLVAGSANPVARRVHARLLPLGRASVRGRLHALRDATGWYPVLRPGSGTVRGSLYEARPGFGRSDLALLDGWEDFDPRRPARSHYLRRAIPVRMEDGRRLSAQAYVFNRRLPATARRIDDGDFAAWLERTHLQAFGTRPDPRSRRLNPLASAVAAQ